VLYLYEMTEMRRTEAWHAAVELKFTPVFAPPGKRALSDGVQLYQSVFVPSRRDHHVHHRQANALFRQYATHFYGVDMGENALPLRPADAALKRKWLNEFYPSQRDLWEHDDSYWLFEDIRATDYDVYRSISFGGGRYLVQALEQYSEAIEAWVQTKDTLEADPILFSQLISLCPSGRVTLKTTAKEYST
jgi:hypothetical protein